jgi:hypothetical protein
MKLNLLILSLLASTFCLFSQTPINKKGPENKQNEKTVARPIAFDSTQTLEDQFKPENQYQFIGLKLFLPPVINPESGPILFSKPGSGFERGNKYYTVVSILKGSTPELLRQKELVNLCGYRYKDLKPAQWQDLIVHVVFVLQENGGGDSLRPELIYWVVCESKTPPYSNSYFDAFVATPYFEKEKQVYQDQQVINLSDKSKWLCKEVSIRKTASTTGSDSTYAVFCNLVDEKGNLSLRRPPSEKLGRTFITEKEYIRLDHANRNQKEQLRQAEQEQRDKHKAECISLFGQSGGELISENKIETGMTSQMCKAAWGAPWTITRTKHTTGTKEKWFYAWNYVLIFENNLLVKIEH